MAFDPVPTGWIANYSSNGTNLTLPIASFPELTAAEAHTSTGDIRKIIFALLERLNAKYASLAAADRPGKLTILKSASFNSATNKIVANYLFQIELDVSGMEVAAES
jgi:hypothetical protein